MELIERTTITTKIGSQQNNSLCRSWCQKNRPAAALNLTANHSGVPCWERCQVPRTLKNPALVFDRSGKPSASPQEAKLPDPTHPSFFLAAIKICQPYYPCVPFLFSSSSSSFHVNFIIHFVFIA